MSNTKALQKERRKLKSKIKLWCVLNDIPMGVRQKPEGVLMVYQEACDKCRAKNKGECVAKKRNVLIMDVHCNRMYTIKDDGGLRYTKWERKIRNNKFIWCVEWVHYV